MLRALAAATPVRSTGRRAAGSGSTTRPPHGCSPPRGRLTPGGLLLVDDIGDVDGLVVENGSAAAWAATTAYEMGPDNALTLGQPVTGLTATTGSYWPGPQVRITAR